MTHRSTRIARSVRTLRASALLALGAVAACGELPERPPRVGDALPEFSAPLRLGDGEMSFADLEGSPALVNVWATWCPPCRSETPYLQQLADELGPHGLQVVGVTVDNASARGAVDDFLASVGASYTQLMDSRGVTMDLFGLIGLPATFVVDAEGTVTYFDLGPVDDGNPDFAAALAALLPDGVTIPGPDDVG